MSNLTNLFSNIANSIRLSSGTLEQIVADNFPNAISNISVYEKTNVNEYISSSITSLPQETWNKIANSNLRAYAFANCYNLTGSPVCSNTTDTMASVYYNCHNLTGSPVCGENVTDMPSTYFGCRNLTGSPVCGNKVTMLSATYAECYNLTGSPVCGENVVSFSQAYRNCYNLTGSPVCSNKADSLLQTYANCTNLTGSPVCGNNVTTMYSTYTRCINLTGSPVCGNNVINMSMTYYNCQNIIGSPICGDNVTTMYNTYYNCQNLTGSPVCGNKVTNMYGTYARCINLHGNAYFYSNNISNVAYCFDIRNTSNRLNIYVHENTTSLNTLLINNSNSLIGANIEWTNDMANTGTYYNTYHNIYICPVANVYDAYENEYNIARKLVDFTYDENEDGTYTITGWKGTYHGIESTECIVPDSNMIRIM